MKRRLAGHEVMKGLCGDSNLGLVGEQKARIGRPVGIENPQPQGLGTGLNKGLPQHRLKSPMSHSQK